MQKIINNQTQDKKGTEKYKETNKLKFQEAAAKKTSKHISF